MGIGQTISDVLESVFSFFFGVANELFLVRCFGLCDRSRRRNTRQEGFQQDRRKGDCKENHDVCNRFSEPFDRRDHFFL